MFNYEGRVILTALEIETKYGLKKRLLDGMVRKGRLNRVKIGQKTHYFEDELKNVVLDFAYQGREKKDW